VVSVVVVFSVTCVFYSLRLVCFFMPSLFVCFFHFARDKLAVRESYEVLPSMCDVQVLLAHIRFVDHNSIDFYSRHQVLVTLATRLDLI
jgi:hypothetical protein